jgi:hypothetical protein
MGTSGIAVTIIVAWIAAIGLSLPILFARFKAKKLAKIRTEKKLENVISTITEFGSRLQIVRSHAIDYLNSLGPDGARQMSEIQALLARIQLAADQARTLLDSESFSKMRLAEKILDGEEAIYLEDSGSGNASNWEFKIADGWNTEVEKKLQELGANVATASTSAKNVGIPTFGRQFKRETIHDLKEAGIDIKAFRDKLPQ